MTGFLAFALVIGVCYLILRNVAKQQREEQSRNDWTDDQRRRRH